MISLRFVCWSTVAVCLGAPCWGQWSKDPAASSLLCDGAGAEVQPKLEAASDGGSYLSFYDSDPSGSRPSAST